MKRSISFVLILAILSGLILSGCGKNEPSKNTTNKDIVEEMEDKESEGIVVDKNILSVEIRFPKEIVGDTSSFNEDEYLAENGGWNLQR